LVTVVSPPYDTTSGSAILTDLRLAAGMGGGEGRDEEQRAGGKRGRDEEQRGGLVTDLRLAVGRGEVRGRGKGEGVVCYSHRT
jgi:hypothetical protein